MICSAAMLDGLLLAATARGDGRSGPHASGTPNEHSSGLAAGLAQQLQGGMKALEQGSTADRHLALRRVAQRLQPTITATSLPARARALLAAEVERERGERWLREAPPPRRGFRASPGLRATLARWGRDDAAPTAEDDTAARGRGRRALVRARRLLPADDACLRELHVEAEEAVAVQTLEGLVPETSDGASPELLRMLLRASAARPAELDVSLAVGRMLDGAMAEEDGRALGPLQRTGRELAEWMDATCPA